MTSPLAPNSLFVVMKFATVLLLSSLACAAHAAEPATLKLTQTIPLPGVQGRFDHFAIDGKGRRLFVAALGNNTLEVIDLAAGKRIQSVAGMSKPTGILYLPESNRIFVANGDDGTLKILDGAEFKVTKTITALEDADNLRFDPKTKRAYLGYADGALGIIDATSGNESARVPLPKHPESFQLEQAGNRIFVNVPDAKQVAVIDREKKSVVATWPMEKFQANFPMALDEANHRLFVGCRQPARLVVFDTATGKPVTDLEISGDTDDLFFDAKRQRLYLSCGEGFLDVLQRRAGDRYERIARQPTRGGARTCFYSPDLDRLYLAVPQRNGQDAEIRVYQPE
jgi:DNA-binding beta-propeller fold protein YncE